MIGFEIGVERVFDSRQTYFIIGVYDEFFKDLGIEIPKEKIAENPVKVIENLLKVAISVEESYK